MSKNLIKVATWTLQRILKCLSGVVKETRRFLCKPCKNTFMASLSQLARLQPTEHSWF